MLSTLTTIAFAPLFLLLIEYFPLRAVVLGYLVIALIYFVYKYYKTDDHKELIVPTGYILLLSSSFYFSSIESVKYIPTALSMLFLVMFMDAHQNKKHLVLKFTKQFYKKELSEAETEFLKNGDLYWVWVMSGNTLIHIIVVNYASDTFWAFWASVGWYGYFFSALFAQIIYAKVLGVQVHTR